MYSAFTALVFLCALLILIQFVSSLLNGSQVRVWLLSFEHLEGSTHISKAKAKEKPLRLKGKSYLVTEKFNAPNMFHYLATVWCSCGPSLRDLREKLHARKKAWQRQILFLP